MTESDIHRPTPEFRDRLQASVLSAFRDASARNARRRSRWNNMLRVAAVLIAAVAIGTSAGIASAQIVDRSRRDSLVQAAEAQLYLVMIRLELAQAEYADVQKRTQVGAAEPETLTAAAAQVREAEAHAKRARLNIEEIKASSTSPRDELNAPLVGGRDYVSERLMLDLMIAQQSMTAAEHTRDETVRREQLGVASATARMDAELEVTKARATLATLASRRNLRKEFLEKGTPVDGLMRRQDKLELQTQAMVAQQELTVAQQRLALAEKAFNVGTAEKLDVLRAQVAVREREMELALIAKRLKP